MSYGFSDVMSGLGNFGSSLFGGQAGKQMYATPGKGGPVMSETQTPGSYLAYDGTNATADAIKNIDADVIKTWGDAYGSKPMDASKGLGMGMLAMEQYGKWQDRSFNKEIHKDRMDLIRETRAIEKKDREGRQGLIAALAS